MVQPPAIVIPAYNRSYSLARLLQSVAQAKFSRTDIPLIISIDKNESEETYKLADDFAWAWGTKTVRKTETHLGLKEHILQCGDLSNAFGTVIILEDDLFVSPYFYDYTLQALDFNEKNHCRQVAGISLFNYEIAESSFCPFQAFEDGVDNYYLQIASSWGQCWTSGQWDEFRNWYAQNPKILSTEKLPRYILDWSETSWKKHFIRFLIATDRYFFFPRVSLSTNFGEPGTNTDRRGLFQSALLTHEKNFQFTDIENSRSIYDASFEMKGTCFQKVCPRYAAYEIEIDLYGTKKLSQDGPPYLLSSKPCKNPIQQFGNELQPLLLNILLQNNGSIFHFGKRQDFEETTIHKDIFYPALSSVADIVFYEKIKALSETRIENQLKENKLRDDFKEIGVVVFVPNNYEYLTKTLQSIRGQNYPHIHLIVVCNKNLALDLDALREFKSFEVITIEQGQFAAQEYVAELLKTRSSLFIQVNSGDVILPNVFHVANKIFKQFSFIHLLRGLSNSKSSQGNLPSNRINKNIFLKQRQRSGYAFEKSCLFFDRYLVEKIIANITGNVAFSNDLLLFHLLDSDALYTTPFVFSAPAYEAQKNETLILEKASWGLADSLAQYFFEKDVTYLRYFFQHWQQLPPVVRFEDTNGSYYLSNY